MSSPAVTVTPEMSIEELTQRMTEHHYNGFPVVNDVEDCWNGDSLDDGAGAATWRDTSKSVT